MDTPDLDRLTILERAQRLHDATLRRHGEMLDAHEEARVQHAARMADLRDLAARQQQLQADVHAMMAGLLSRQDTQTLRLEHHAERMAALEALAAQHQERMDRLQQVLDAIKDMLDRGNGH